MARAKRRSPRRRLPGHFSNIGITEQVRWSIGQIHIEGRVTFSADHEYDPNDVVYESWLEWLKVYETCRLDYLASRRPSMKEPVSEKLFRAINEGIDPESVLADLKAEDDANDPRRMLKDIKSNSADIGRPEQNRKDGTIDTDTNQNETDSTGTTNNRNSKQP